MSRVLEKFQLPTNDHNEGRSVVDDVIICAST